MENQEIKKFDANEALKSVKEKIKDSFVSLIPDEQWNEMVKKEVDSYFKETKEGYGERGYSSSFTKDVHSILSQEVKERVKQYLIENFNTVWINNGVPVCNQKVEQIITNNAGKILSDMIGGTIQLALQNAGYRM
jgi:FKBP-type peptidyl-prolyl cis-trans isomerase (trigger factor)